MAFAKLGDHEKAYQLFSMINPINHSKTLTGAQKYKVEPYVMSADVYGIAPHLGRGGWSWYTGSSSWMYRCALESILGFHLHSNKVILKPCIPHSWPQFKISYLYKKTSYQILVLNNQNEESIEVDGIKSMGNEFILSESNKEVQVIVKILSH
jgi:cellobiose phosphorylase